MQLKTALHPAESFPGLQGGCTDYDTGYALWGDKQILRAQSGLKEGCSHFGLQIRVEVAIGQILAGKQ